MQSDLPYRPCVGMMILNKDNKVLVAKRLDNNADAWQMPQGGIDDGEDPHTAVYREMEEEIGTRNAEIIDEHRDWLKYDLPDHMIGKIWKGRYRGQRMKWFLMRYLGADSDINIETEHPEFSEWKWMDMDHIPQAIVDFKRPLYEQLVTYFTPKALGGTS